MQYFDLVFTYEMAYLRRVLTEPWKNVTVLQPAAAAAAQDRNKVLEHMRFELMEILKRVQSQSFIEIVAPLCKLTNLAKHLTDSKPALHFYQMLACLLMNIGRFN